MQEPPGKIATLSLGCGLVVLIATAVLAQRIIADLAGSTVTPAAAQWALFVIVGGVALSAVLVAIPIYVLARWALAGPTPEARAAADARPEHAPLAASGPTAAEYQEIIASAPDGIITVDAGQRIVVFNRAAEQMFGVPSEEAIGGPLARPITERHRQVLAEHVRRLGERGTDGWSVGEP